MKRVIGALAFVLLSLTPAWAQVPDCQLRPVVNTHTLPPYPPAAVRESKSGVTLLIVKIAPDGVPDAAVVEKSSGSALLDAGALNHVKSHWRWTNTCSRELATRVSVKWALRKSMSSPVVGLALMLIGILMITAGSSLAFEFPLFGKAAEWLRRTFDETSLSGARGAGMWLMIGGVFVLLIGGATMVPFVRGLIG